MQISFSDMERKITKITTWGGGKGLGYVKVYRLAFTEVGDNRVWSDYKEGDKTRVSSIIFLFPRISDLGHAYFVNIILEYFLLGLALNSRIVPESFPETFYTTWPHFESTEFSVRHVVNFKQFHSPEKFTSWLIKPLIIDDQFYKMANVLFPQMPLACQEECLSGHFHYLNRVFVIAEFPW